MSCSVCYGYSNYRCPCCSADEPECRECGGSLHEDASDSECCTCYARCDCGRRGHVTRVRLDGDPSVYLVCDECLAEDDAAEAHPADLSAVIAVATGDDARLAKALRTVCG